MKRRTILLGTGAIAGGGASLLGTGAFSAAQATRSVHIDVVADEDALLQLVPCEDSPNGQYVSGSSNGEMVIELSEESNLDAVDDGDGKGVNSEARTLVHRIFEIGNQGTQDVCVDLTVSDPPTIQEDAELPDDYYDFGGGDEAVVFYRGDDESAVLSSDEREPEEGFTLPVGERECIGLDVRAFGVDEEEELFEDLHLTIVADATADCTEEDT